VIDFHCHLDLYPDPAAEVRACVDQGLDVLSVTTTPSAWSGTSALTASARIRTALGLHPQIAHERKSELALFERLLPDVPYVGEVGLDGSPGLRQHWNDQVLVFGRILSACGAVGGRLLSIHSRRAAAAVLDMLEASPGAGTAVLHWFSGTSAELARAVALGCWFSVGPAMLTAKKGRELAARMPRDRTLTESDGPFAQVHGRAAVPFDVGLAVDGLTKLWDITRCEADHLFAANLERLACKHESARRGSGDDPSRSNDARTDS
jgi:TatD DNase family protein